MVRHRMVAMHRVMSRSEHDFPHLAAWTVTTTSKLIGVRPLAMHDSSYYQEQAARAKHLAKSVGRSDVADVLAQIAQDYEDIADDLRRGAVKVRHLELVRQLTRDR
jgi:hypothetical protein